jgi:hypothetical protein
MRLVRSRETLGLELGGVQELNEMAVTKQKMAPTDEAYYVSAADLADKIIVLMLRGLDPLSLSSSTWAVVQTSQCQAIN